MVEPVRKAVSTGDWHPAAFSYGSLTVHRALALSEFDEELRLGDPAVAPFQARLAERLPAVERFHGIPPAWRAAFGPLPAPRDWLYPFPEVRVHHP